MDIKKDIAVSDSGFVFYPVTGEAFSVNPLGMEIIKLMKEDKTISEITEYVVANFNVEPSTAEKDIHDFFEMLNHFSLMEENGEA